MCLLADNSVKSLLRNQGFLTPWWLQVWPPHQCRGGPGVLLARWNIFTCCVTLVRSTCSCRRSGVPKSVQCSIWFGSNSLRSNNRTTRTFLRWSPQLWRFGRWWTFRPRIAPQRFGCWGFEFRSVVGSLSTRWFRAYASFSQLLLGVGQFSLNAL